MPTRFILNELDVNLPPLAPRLIVVVVIVVGRGGDARSLDAPIVAVAVAGHAQGVVLGARAVLVVGILDFGHGEREGSIVSRGGRMGWSTRSLLIWVLIDPIGNDVDSWDGDYLVGFR